jgi:hypothetical protein
MLAGKAIVTVVSVASGCRYTYRIRAKDTPEGEDTVHFVSVLQGPENTRDYTFLGTIFAGKRFFHGKKSKISEDAPSARAWSWYWNHLDSDKIEVYHAGKCGRCGRLLTDPDSIERGLGPKCAEY